MGRQRVKNLHRDFLKERDKKRGKVEEQRSEQQVSFRQTGKQTVENLQMDRYHRGISEYRQRQTGEIQHPTERGREEESKNRDLSNRSLKTDGGTESKEPT